MAQIKFTDSVIRSLKPAGSGKVIYWADGVPGFGLRIGTHGTKSFVSKTYLNGRQRMVKLGEYPKMTLLAALVEHKRVVDAADRVEDPFQDSAQNCDKTISVLAESYFDHRKAMGFAGHSRERSIFNKDICPVIGGVHPRDITSDKLRTLMLGVLERIQTARPDVEGAGRSHLRHVHVALRGFFNWLCETGVLKDNPAAAIKTMGAVRVKERVLSPAEIWVFWHGLAATGVSLDQIHALKFILVTGQRPKEVRSMKWGDIDDGGGFFTVRAETAKNKKMHRVPLNDLAKEIIRAQRPKKKELADIRDQFVFPGKTKTGRLGETSLADVLRRKADVLGSTDFSPHDLRRTAATMIAAMGLPSFYASLLLNHAQQGVTNRVYVQYSYDAEKKKAADVINLALTKIIKSSAANKVPSIEKLRESAAKIVAM